MLCSFVGIVVDDRSIECTKRRTCVLYCGCLLASPDSRRAHGKLGDRGFFFSSVAVDSCGCRGLDNQQAQTTAHQPTNHPRPTARFYPAGACAGVGERAAYRTAPFSTYCTGPFCLGCDPFGGWWHSGTQRIVRIRDNRDTTITQEEHRSSNLPSPVRVELGSGEKTSN